MSVSEWKQVKNGGPAGGREEGGGRSAAVTGASEDDRFWLEVELRVLHLRELAVCHQMHHVSGPKAQRTHHHRGTLQEQLQPGPAALHHPAHLPRLQRPASGADRWRAAPDQQQWSCHMCTYLNWPRAIRCTQCLSQRQQGSQHGPLSPSEAPQTSDSGSRPTPVTSDPCEEYNDRNRLNMHTQRWPCSACTYENWPKSLRCVVCDHPKPSGSPEAPQQDSEAESATSPSIVNEQERDNLRTAGGGGWAGAGRGNSLHLHVKGRRRWRLSWRRERWAAINEQEADFKNSNRSGNRMRRSDWLFLNACAGEKWTPLVPDTVSPKCIWTLKMHFENVIALDWVSVSI